MRVIAIRKNFLECPQYLKDTGFSNQSEVELSIDKQYTVWAISRWRGILFFQVINDLNYPSWLPAWLFKIIDNSVPCDWRFSVFDNALEMVLGPEFIANDEQAYTQMVELYPSAVDAFWRYVKKVESTE